MSRQSWKITITEVEHVTIPYTSPAL